MPILVSPAHLLAEINALIRTNRPLGGLAAPPSDCNRHVHRVNLHFDHYQWSKVVETQQIRVFNGNSYRTFEEVLQQGI